MKILLGILFFITISINAKSQTEVPYDESKIILKEGKITYTFIDTLKEISSSKIHSLLSEWGAKSFNNYSSVLQLNDKENGKIILKGSDSKSYFIRFLGKDNEMPYNQKFTIDFTIKDGRYRTIISDFFLTGTSIGDLRLEEHLKTFEMFPNYSKANKNEKVSINTSRQILNNTLTTASYIFDSVKNFVANGIKSSIKKDDDF